MIPTIVLFDVDGTLVLTGGAGRRALGRAFGDVLGRPEVAEAVDLRGMTDLGILRSLIASAGAVYGPELLGRLVERYLLLLAEELTLAPGFVVLPGVAHVVSTLRGRPGVALGLGTGNLERGARLKLQRGALDTAFAFGGFGDDAEERAALVARGAERGIGHLGVESGRCRVVVIGDTPRDVAAAAAIGAECVAVATGGFTRDELVRAGATQAFSNLAEPGALAAILGGEG